MALTRTQKTEIIDQVDQILASSKLTVVAGYRGLTVAQSQDLRQRARQNGSRVLVAKNRLVKQALAKRPELAKVPTDDLAGMLIYVFNDGDEVAPAQTIKSFCDQTKVDLEIVGAINPQGEFLDRELVVRYASLPSREQLLANVLASLQTPLQQTIGALRSPSQKVVGALQAKE